MVHAAIESAILAHKASRHRFTQELERHLLDAFEACFSHGYAIVHALRADLTKGLLDGLVNKKMHEDDNGQCVAARAKIEAHFELRKYFQEVALEAANTQRSWWARAFDVVRFVLPFFFRGH